MANPIRRLEGRTEWPLGYRITGCGGAGEKRVCRRVYASTFDFLKDPSGHWPISTSPVKEQVRRSQDTEPELLVFLKIDGPGLETSSGLFYL